MALGIITDVRVGVLAFICSSGSGQKVPLAPGRNWSQARELRFLGTDEARPEVRQQSWVYGTLWMPVTWKWGHPQFQ